MMRVWRLSVVYIGPKSRTERPRKTKIGTEVAHVTRDSDTTFKVRRSNVNLFDWQKGIACAHILLCFALLWQRRHKLGKIAQCLFFRVVVVCLLANSVVNCSLWRFSYLQLIMVRLAGAGAYCVATRTACQHQQGNAWRAPCSSVLERNSHEMSNHVQLRLI